MAEKEFTPETQPQTEPELRRTKDLPKGVLQKNLKTFVYLGAALLVIVAAIFSSSGKKTPSQQATANHQPPQPMIQDNTDNNVQDLKNQLQAERQKEQQQAALTDSTLGAVTPAQRAAMAPLSPTGQCVPGQPCPRTPPGYAQTAAPPTLTPEQQQVQQLAAKERERADDSRFASNLVYVRPPDPPRQTQSQPQEASQMMPASQPKLDSGLVPPGSQKSQPDANEDYKRPVEANIDSATGPPYLLYEGTVLDTTLMNRLDADAIGDVKALVSIPIYSHDRQHVLIPDGTIALGQAKRIGAAGFGQQRRIAIVFHRLIMPDGYSVDLDRFHGLDQIGEEGTQDKVNNHYLQIFGTSIALGVVAGASQIEEGGGTITTSGSQAFTNGAAASVSQSATTILDRFMMIPSTLKDMEGLRIKIYFTQDMLLPAYTNHTIPQTF